MIQVTSHKLLHLAAILMFLIGMVVLRSSKIIEKKEASRSEAPSPLVQTVNALDEGPIVCPEVPPAVSWPQWGGALNSANEDGNGFFDCDKRRQFIALAIPSVKKYIIELNSRAFLPSSNQSALADIFSISSESSGIKMVYLQFVEHPTQAQRQKMEESGVELLSYVSGYAWVARGKKGAFEATLNEDWVRGLARIDPRDKLQAAVYAAKTPGYAMDDEGRVHLMLLTVPGTKAVDLAEMFSRQSGLNEIKIREGFSSVLGPRFELTLPALLSPVLGLAEMIAQADLTSYVEYVPPPVAARDATTDEQSNVIDVRDNSSNLDGSGVKVALREIGRMDIHNDCVGRLQFIDTSSDTRSPSVNHATAVAGQVGSNGTVQPGAKGIAPAVSMLAYSLDDGDFEPADIIDAASRGARISNHSYGPSGLMSFGDYQSISADWDNAIRSKDLVGMFAGNEELGGRYKHIDFFVGAKNTICVAASNAAAHAEDDNPATSQSDGIAFFSEFGPMLDGRVKPDLVAFGDRVLLDQGTSGVATNSGTSFSTPAVSGIAALVFQEFKAKLSTEPSAALAKAILCNSATDLGLSGPDAIYGFGLVNVEQAVKTIDLFQSSAVSPFFEGVLANGQATAFTATVPSVPQLKITLCWMDVAGIPGATRALVNDIDLELQAPDGSILYPFSLDPVAPSAAATNSGPNRVDPIEQTVVNNPAAGVWTIRVKAGSIPLGNQNFAVCLNLIRDPGLVSSVILASPSQGAAPLNVSFSGNLSTSSITRYAWTFGDGSTGEGDTLQHTYAAPGSYGVTLMVSDENNNQSSSTITIVVTKRQVSANGFRTQGKLNFKKLQIDKLRFSLVAPDLMLPLNQAREAIHNRSFEGKTFKVRIGETLIGSAVLDNRGGFRSDTLNFRLNPLKGVIDVQLNKTDLVAAFNALGMTVDPSSSGPHEFAVQVEGDDAIFEATFSALYKNTNGISASFKGGPR